MQPGEPHLRLLTMKRMKDMKKEKSLLHALHALHGNFRFRSGHFFSTDTAPDEYTQ